MRRTSFISHPTADHIKSDLSQQRTRRPRQPQADPLSTPAESFKGPCCACLYFVHPTSLVLSTACSVHISTDQPAICVAQKPPHHPPLPAVCRSPSGARKARSPTSYRDSSAPSCLKSSKQQTRTGPQRDTSTTDQNPRHTTPYSVPRSSFISCSPTNSSIPHAAQIAACVTLH